MAPTKKNHLFWQIPVLLILIPAAVELWYPGAVMSLPVLSKVKARWYAMRLGNDDPKIQESAAWTLGEMGPKAKGAVPALIAALDSSHAEVCDAAARALGEIGPGAEAAVPSLIRLQEKESGVTLNAAQALGKIGEPALVPLITGLQDKDPSVREQAADTLGSICLVVDDPRLAQKAMQPLLNALQDEDMGVRSAALSAMQGVVPAAKDPETRATVAKALIRAMKDAPFHIGALLKFAEAGLEPLISALEDEDTPMQPVVPGVEVPKSHGTTVEQLLRIMAGREELYGFGAASLSKIGQPALEPLINALQDEDVRVRRAAAMAMQNVLAAVKDPQIRARAVEPLIGAMQDADGKVRAYVPVALSKIGEPAVEPLLRIVLEQNTKEHVILAAFALAQILGASKDGELGRRIVQPLIAALKEDSPEFRRQAAGVLLVQINTPEAIEAVRNAGFDPESAIPSE